MFDTTDRVAPEKAVFRPALPLVSLLGITEMQMAKNYFEKLKDPRWQKKRLEVLEAIGFASSAWMARPRYTFITGSISKAESLGNMTQDSLQFFASTATRTHTTTRTN